MGHGICSGDGTSAKDGSGDKPTLESAEVKVNGDVAAEGEEEENAAEGENDVS